MGRRGVVAAHRAAARLGLRARGGGAALRGACLSLCPRSNAADPARTARPCLLRVWQGWGGRATVDCGHNSRAKNTRPPAVFSFSTPSSLFALLLQNTMNLLLLGALSLPVGYLGYGYLSLFVPPK